MSDQTKVQKSTNDEVNSVSQPIAKPLVGCSLSKEEEELKKHMDYWFAFQDKISFYCQEINKVVEEYGIETLNYFLIQNKSITKEKRVSVFFTFDENFPKPVH